MTFSSGDAARAVHAISQIRALIETVGFALPLVQSFPLEQVTEAHRASEGGHARAKLVPVVGRAKTASPQGASRAA